jgi:hypothetical protein
MGVTWPTSRSGEDPCTAKQPQLRPHDASSHPRIPYPVCIPQRRFHDTHHPLCSILLINLPSVFVCCVCSDYSMEEDVDYRALSPSRKQELIHRAIRVLLHND